MLTGPSRPLDPRTQAVRGDLADIRLAEQVFAPHYVDPVPRRVIRATILREGRAADSETVASMIVGDRFELLDVTSGCAWGVSPSHNLVGYLDSDALGAIA